MDTNLVEISKNLIDNIEKIDDFIDSYFEPITDITDTAGDIFAPIKAIHALFNLSKKVKFKNFLKSYAESLKENNFSSVNNLDNLKKYIKNEKNLNYLNLVIENALNSKSKYGSVLLGYFAGLVLSKEIDIGFKEIIIIEGIKDLNDIELSCFANIYDVANLKDEVNIQHYKKLEGLKFFCELTIEKLIQIRIVGKPMLRADGGQIGRFYSTDVAEEIIDIMKSANIYKELLNYSF